MSLTHSRFGARVAALTIVSMLVSPVSPGMALAAQTQTPAAPKPAAPAPKAPSVPKTEGILTPAHATPSTPATPPGTQAKPAVPATPATQPTPATPAAQAAAAPDGSWPRVYTTPRSANLVLYQPQIASWENQQQMVAYSAVSYTAKSAMKPALGTIKLESATKVAVAERLVSFSELQLNDANFPGIDRETVRTIVEEIKAAVPLNERVIGLDRVLASVDASQITPKNVEGLKADAPPIFFSTKPALLVNIDGEPIWAPIRDNDLRSAVNTNWDLFEHSPTKTFYLRNNKTWLKAASVGGPWEPAGPLPDSFKKLPTDDNWREVKASLPGTAIKAADAPHVFVSMQPAEMILLAGEPAYITVAGTQDLFWVSNTESDVFRKGRTGPVYFLVAGRWFSAPDYSGPWTFATPSLPAEFKQIPLEHERSRVLASVPGTTQAAEAILLAQVPQTARVNKTLPPPEVSFEGAPEFQPIETTTVERAVNTDKDIFKVGDLYYMCFEGVWFMSTEPTGPWEVTGEVPAAIYEIPASSPAYPVTYVTVEESSDDAVVFATAMAFTGAMVAWGCVVWGTGYYYPPYVGYGMYYPRYPTYGYRASYNPWTGAYTRGAVAYGPYGGAGVASRYNPRTGTYSRGAAAYGPNGARGAAQAYNPRTGTAAQTRQGSNVYGSWGATNVQRGDQWASTARYTNNRTGTTSRVTETSGGGTAISRTGPGGSGTALRTASGDMYAGKDGNVYRKEGNSWQKFENGGWTGVERPAPTPQSRPDTTNRSTPTGWDSDTASQVKRDSAARSEGVQRTSDLGSVRSGSAPRTTSYRPRAGGGGGRRR